MKIVRWLAAAVLALFSLMNVGIALGGDGAGVALRVLGPVLGLLGFAAVYGLVRRRHWGAPSALAVSAVNVLAALIALMTGSTDDASAGLVVGLIALGLTAATAYADRSGQPQSEPEPTSLSS
jgi:peptidoglycan/LPS O-acetylase OafA/YrhL